MFLRNIGTSLPDYTPRRHMAEDSKEPAKSVNSQYDV
jgi:hypothetical protein